MKKGIRDIIGFTIGATDGEIGQVSEFYFDDETWTLRYVVVKTGNWLSGRKVVIPTASFLKTDWEEKIFHVNITKKQVKDSPDTNTEKTVSRRQEMLWNKHYLQSNYWQGGFYGGGMVIQSAQKLPLADIDGTSADIDKEYHLRSTSLVTGYTIQAIDGSIGEIADFLIDDRTWKIEFVVVDTGDWFPGKHVLIAPDWITKIDWEDSEVTVKVMKELIKTSPEYDAAKPLDDIYVTMLHSHYN